MRVRVVAESTKAYWNYSVQTWKRGKILDGELARHLASNAPEGEVEILEDDREEARAADARARAMAKPTLPAGSDEDSKGTPKDTGDDKTKPEVPPEPEAPVVLDAPPVDGTIEQLMTWIDGNPDRAAQALTAEQGKDKPRSTVVKRLSAMTGAEDE